MLTYHQQPRVFVLPPEQKFQFPNTCVVRVAFWPGGAFGVGDGFSRTIVKGREAKVHVNSNAGRRLGRSNPPLERLKGVFTSSEDANCRLTIDGNVLEFTFQCKSLEHLAEYIIALQWFLPPLLNLGFADPPSVVSVTGRVGDIPFSSEHSPDWRSELRPVEYDTLRQHVRWSFNCLRLFTGVNNRRLAAALTYFHVAVRLFVTPESPWEFMAEVVLNYAKCLEILFKTSGQWHNEVRAGLKSLGYEPEQIETDFIPILKLRDLVDVAHPRLALFEHEHLKVLYDYLIVAEDFVRDMLMRVIEGIQSGSFTLIQENDLEPNPRDTKIMSDLVESMKESLERHRSQPGYKEVQVSLDRLQPAGKVRYGHAN